MKKMICALLALLMLAALAGCSTTKKIPAESDQKTDVILTDSKKENRSIRSKKKKRARQIIERRNR